MKRCCVLLCALLCAPGCISDSGTGVFDNALKDLRGDNMEMRSNNSALKETTGELPSLRYRD